MSGNLGPRPPGRRGFTLIEVVAALVVFTAGVLMVVRVSGSGAAQIRYAGASSELAVRAAERLDSLSAEPFATLAFGTSSDTLIVRGLRYRRTVALVRVTPLLAHARVDLLPLEGEGPAYHLESFLGSPW